MEVLLLSPTQINQWIAREVESFLANIDKQKLNSDLVFQSINKVRIQLAKARISKAG